MNYVGPFIHRRDDIYEVEIFNHIYQVVITSVDMKRDYDDKLELVVKMEKIKQSPIRGIDFIEKEIEKPFVNLTDKELIKMLSKSFNDFYKSIDFSEPFPYFHLSFDEALYTRPSKNRIPDNVFFNDKKKATTLMFGKEATVVKCGKDDEYSRRIGFLEAYFQATCGLSKTKAKKYLENIVKDKEDK